MQYPKKDNGTYVKAYSQSMWYAQVGLVGPMQLKCETVGYVSLHLRVPVGNVQSVVLQSRSYGGAKWECY